MMTDNDNTREALTLTTYTGKTHLNNLGFFKLIAKEIMDAGLPYGWGSGTTELEHILKEGSKWDRRSLYVRFEKADCNVELAITDKMQWDGEKAIDAKGNEFRIENYLVRITGSSWGGDVTNALVLADLITKVTTLAATCQAIANSNKVFLCVATAEEVEDRKIAKFNQEHGTRAGRISQENATRMRVDKEKTISLRGMDEKLIPAPGIWKFVDGSKEFNLHVTEGNNEAILHRVA